MSLELGQNPAVHRPLQLSISAATCCDTAVLPGAPINSWGPRGTMSLFTILRLSGFPQFATIFLRPRRYHWLSYHACSIANVRLAGVVIWWSPDAEILVPSSGPARLYTWSMTMSFRDGKQHT